eukprot:6196355-Amphidinium_carterae.1
MPQSPAHQHAPSRMRQHGRRAINSTHKFLTSKALWLVQNLVSHVHPRVHSAEWCDGIHIQRHPLEAVSREENSFKIANLSKYV